MSHLTRYYVSCFLCWGRRVLRGLYGAFPWRQSVSVCVKHLWTCQSCWDHIWPPVTFSLAVICCLSTVFCPFSTLYLPSRCFFGFPFPPCSVYLHRSSLLVGLVFPTFLSVWNKTGSETRERQDSEVGWDEGRGDGCKTGWETEEEREPRRSQSRETGSSTSKLNLPSQQGLARRYLTYYFTRAYLKSLFQDEIQVLEEKKVVSQNNCCIQSKLAVGSWQNFN